MPGGERDVDDALALSLASGMSHEAAAKAVDISLATLYRRLQRPEFRAKVDAARLQMLEQTVAKLTSLGSGVVLRLNELMESDKTPAAVRVSAGRTPLEYLFRGFDALTLSREVAELKRLLGGDDGGESEGGGEAARGDDPRPGGGGAATLERLKADPAATLTAAGMTPDRWQLELLRSCSDWVLLLCARQTGKSTACAALALHTALAGNGRTVLLLAPTLQQSVELHRKVLDLYGWSGRPLEAVREGATFLELANGSRVVALPGEASNVRGFSPDLVIVDEAALTADALLPALSPMVSVSGGRLVAASTPSGQRGWFFDGWQSGEGWARVRVPAAECPRISPEFLASERRSLGERWFSQEYECNFVSTVDAVFDPDTVRQALTDAVRPLFPGVAA